MKCVNNINLYLRQELPMYCVSSQNGWLDGVHVPCHKYTGLNRSYSMQKNSMLMTLANAN